MVKPEDPVDLAEGIMKALARTEDTDVADWRSKIADYVRTEYAQGIIIHELE